MNEFSSPSPGSPHLGLIDGIPARELLDGLGELHESVIVTDRTGRVVWASHALDRLAGGRSESIDKPLAALCERFVADAMRGRQRDDDEGARMERDALNARLDEVLSRLESYETVVQFTLTTTPAIELSAFAVESHIEDGDARSKRRVAVPLFVVILRERSGSDSPRRAEPPRDDIVSTVLDRHPDATLVIDSTGFVSYANDQAVALLGSTREGLIDSPITAHLPIQAIAPAHLQAFSSDAYEAERYVVEVERRSGHTAWLEVSHRRVDTEDGHEVESPGFVVAIRDASQQRRTIDRLKQKIHALESYVHTVSHDLRSPLVAMLGFTRLLQKEHGTRLDDRGRTFLQRIESAGANMNRMTRDLLELSTRAKRAAGERPLTDPREILLEIKAELKTRLDDYGIELKLPTAPPLIQCERTPLYQLFSNLIGNAIQHMGNVDAPRIDVQIAEAPGQRIIVVRDNGLGIDPTHRPKIFEAFESMPRSEDLASTGVGLSIVKKIAEQHGGRVDVESSPGEGATFTVVLDHI